MLTRFRSASRVHLMNVPLDVPHDIRGSKFYGCLTGAYDYEEEYVLSWILRIAKEFKIALEQSDLHEQPGVPELLSALNSTIDFLESIPDEQVTRRKPISEAADFEDLLEINLGEQVSLYSYDRAPSINEILDAYREGRNGIHDWAIEELEKKGDKGRRELLSVLKKEKNKDRRLTALELLIVIFRDDQTRTAVQRFLDNCGEEMRQAVQAIIANYRSAQSGNVSPVQSRRSGPNSK